MTHSYVKTVSDNNTYNKLYDSFKCENCGLVSATGQYLSYCWREGRGSNVVQLQRLVNHDQLEVNFWKINNV